MVLQARRRQGAGMGRVGRTIARLAIATALSTGVVASPALAQGMLGDSVAAGTGGQANDRLLVEAIELIYDNDRNTVTASGDVEMNYGGRSLQADRVVYDRNTGRVFAEGNARLVEADGTIVTGDQFELTDDFRSGFIDTLRVERTAMDPQGHVRTRFTAPRAERIDGQQTIFERGIYTACDTCEEDPLRPPLWQIRAARVIHNNEEQTIYYENASLEFLGIPIAYVPYFWSPDGTVKRKTGFLTPSLIISEKLGNGLTVPFFWVTGPNHDITLRPSYLSRQGVLGDVEWRHRLMTGSYNIRTTGIFQKDPKAFPVAPFGADDRKFRGSVETKGRFHINERWSWGWNATAITDRFYIDDYKISARSLTDLFLRDAVSTVYLTGQGDRSWFDLRGYYFKGLSFSDFQKHQPLVHPVLDYNKRIDGPGMIGGEVALDVNFTSLSRQASQFQPANPLRTQTVGSYAGIASSCAEGFFNPGDCLVPGVAGTYNRVSTQLSWRRRFIDDFGQSWTPFAYARADAIMFSPNTSGFQNAKTANFVGSSDQFRLRFMPAVGLEYRYPLIASAGRWGSQVIEPVAQIVARPDEARIGRLPNEDSHTVVFDTSNLLSWDRFAGYDRTEGGVRGNYGLQYTLAGTNGFYANAMIGQSAQIAGRNSFATGDLVNAGRGSGLDSRLSDYVARLRLQPTPNLSFLASGLFDKESLNAKRLEASATATIGPVSGSLTYARLAAQRDTGSANRREGLSGSARLQLSKHWSASGSVLFDLTRFLDERPNLKPGAKGVGRFAVASTTFGLGYADECTTFSVNYTAVPKDGVFGSKNQDRSVMLRLELRTLGDIGVTQTLDNEPGQGGLFR
jgi:LPS-assembly protein